MSRVFVVLAALLVFELHAAAPVDGIHFERMTTGDTSYDTADLDLKRADLKLYWKNSDGHDYESLTEVRSTLKADGKTFLMATNAGIYASDYTPLGLHIERGKELHALNKSHASRGNFFMNPNGVFFLTAKGAAQIFETAEFAALKPAAVEASQSGPLLLRKGKVNPRFHEESDNKKLRSGVGVNADGHVIFAISAGAVGFYEFAVFFRDTLHCADALYLDGTISTLLVADRAVPTQLVAYTGIWAATLK
jgi:uncharacterized protein YigE (DUF2233 family)